MLLLMHLRQHEGLMNSHSRLLRDDGAKELSTQLEDQPLADQREQVISDEGAHRADEHDDQEHTYGMVHFL
eukprot:SAG11_NODE_2604_length_3179_cov_2.347078_4_plen_70_part_01